MGRKNERTAVDAYVAHKSVAFKLLHDIREQLNKGYDRKGPDEINWADVGSMEFIEKRLQEVLDMMQGTGEYSN